MATINVEMDGSWVAVAGEGWSTITARNARAEWAIGATEPDAGLLGHIAKNEDDRAFELETGEKLWVKGDHRFVVVVDRQTAP